MYGENVKPVRTALSTLAIAISLAACGSAAHKTGASGSAAAAGTPAAATTSGSSGGGYGAYGPYSSGASGSSSSGSSAGGSAAGTAVKLTTKHSKLGTILAAGPKQLTVYMFEGDTAGKSNCNGACTGVWPPVMAGTAAVAGLAMKADISTITRSDGTKQLAYKGHPLYYFVRDKDSGDAYGEGVHGFGHNWYVLAPSGDKIDNS